MMRPSRVALTVCCSRSSRSALETVLSRAVAMGECASELEVPLVADSCRLTCSKHRSCSSDAFLSVVVPSITGRICAGRSDLADLLPVCVSFKQDRLSRSGPTDATTARTPHAATRQSH